MATMKVESKAVAYFNIFNAQVTSVAEGPDSVGGFTYAGDNPTNDLISTAQSLTVNFKWNASGIIPSITTIEYKVSVYVETMGAAEAVPGVYTNTLVIASASPAGPYTLAVVLPAGLPVGMHRLTGTITTKTIPGNVNLPTAGFIDLGFIQVYPNS